MEKEICRRHLSREGTGCVWVFINMFDFRHGGSNQKLLIDKKRGSKRIIGSFHFLLCQLSYTPSKICVLKQKGFSLCWLMYNNAGIEANKVEKQLTCDCDCEVLVESLLDYEKQMVLRNQRLMLNNDCVYCLRRVKVEFRV